MTDSTSSKKGFWDGVTFTRILTSLLCAFIAIIISYNFFCISPEGDINTEIILLISFLIVLGLSESFDNFSVGKVLSLSRRIKEQEKSIEGLKEENHVLREQVVNVSTSAMQHQSMSNHYGLTDEMLKRIVEMVSPQVKPATEEDKKEKIDSYESVEQEKINTYENNDKKIDFNKVENYALKKYMQIMDFPENLLRKDMKLSDDRYSYGSVSKFYPIFDGYVKTSNSEVFIEVQMTTKSVPALISKLKDLLNLINDYARIKEVNAYLVLIIVDIEGKSLPFKYVEDKLEQFFSPAIDKGLLRIVEIKPTEEEIKSFYKTD